MFINPIVFVCFFQVLFFLSSILLPQCFSLFSCATLLLVFFLSAAHPSSVARPESVSADSWWQRRGARQGGGPGLLGKRGPLAALRLTHKPGASVNARRHLPFPFEVTSNASERDSSSA